MIEFTGERVVPWAAGMQPWAHVLRDHLMRYAFAVPCVAGKTVCDVGCGTGYGAYLLSMVARSVAGYDIDAAAIEFACSTFWRDNRCQFGVMDVTDQLPQDYDVYTCFEVLEHVDDAQKILRHIPPTATLVWSVPVNDPGQFHKRVYSLAEAVALVPDSAIYYQYADGRIEAATARTAPHGAKYVIGIQLGVDA